MTGCVRFLNSLLILILASVIGGGIIIQFLGDYPACPLCYLQRLGMVAVAIGAMLNLRFGIRISHYAISLLGAFFGGATSIRQFLLHVCPGAPPYGEPMWGISLWTWAFMVFACSILGIILLLFLYRKEQEEKIAMNFFDHFVVILMLVATLINIGTTFTQCGFGVCAT